MKIFTNLPANPTMIRPLQPSPPLKPRTPSRPYNPHPSRFYSPSLLTSLPTPSHLLHSQIMLQHELSGHKENVELLRGIQTRVTILKSSLTDQRALSEGDHAIRFQCNICRSSFQTPSPVHALHLPNYRARNT